MSFFGYDETDTKFGLGTHINRWCKEAPPDEELSSNLMSGKNHPRFGETHSKETKELMRRYANENNISPPDLEGEENPAKRKEVREKISESMSGSQHWNWNGEIQDEDALIEGIKEAWSEGSYDELVEFLSGDTSPSKREEVRKKISKGVSEAIEERGEPFFTSRKDIDTNGKDFVASSWEKTVYNALYNMGVQFEYEGMSIPYNGNIYFPDFTVQGDLVIEVKGPFVMNPEKVESKAKAGVDREETYVVIGNEDLPCDHHIEYTDNVEDMEDKLDDLIY